MTTFEDKIGVFMRAYGLKIFYFIFVYYFSFHFVDMLTEDEETSKILPPMEYDTSQFLFIWCVRLGGSLSFLTSIPLVAMYFFARFPSFSYEGAAHSKPFNHGDKKIETTSNDLEKADKLRTKRYIPCIIVRIVTRGDYPDLIRRNIEHHLKLFDRYCRYDRLEGHVVTERTIDGDYRFGDNAVVKEFLVPETYRTKNGTLYHARNVCYWLDNAFSNAHDIYPPDDQTWILNLDEDVFCTELFVRDFVDRFLDSGALSSVNPTLYDLPRSAGMIAAYEESFCITLFNAMGWTESRVVQGTPLWYKTAAHMIRCDVDRKIGHDFGPHLSVGDDMVFGNFLADAGCKIGYINGWTWEGGAPSLTGLIKQRARWLRSVIYCTLYQQMSARRRFYNLLIVFVWYIIQGVLSLGALYYAIFSWFENDGDQNYFLFDAPPRSFLDYIVGIAFANHVFGMIFGAWHIMPARRAIVHTLGVCTMIGFVALCACNVAELLCSLWTLTQEFYYRRFLFEVTEKAVRSIKRA